MLLIHLGALKNLPVELLPLCFHDRGASLVEEVVETSPQMETRIPSTLHTTPAS